MIMTQVMSVRLDNSCFAPSPSQRAAEAALGGAATRRRRRTSVDLGGRVPWEARIEGSEVQVGETTAERATEANGGSGRWRTVVAWTAAGAWGTWALVRLAGGDRLPVIQVPAAPL